MRAVYVAVGMLTIPAGLLVRFVHLGLPWFVMKYGGSILWAAMVYWTLAFLRPKSSPSQLASAASLIAILVEFQRLYHSPGLDAFRVSLPGVLLLGRFFSPWDIVAYLLAILTAALLDGRVIRRSTGNTQR
jgi:hypothetical protein